MNARLIIAVPLVVLALVSCDQVKKLGGKASSAVKEQIASKTGVGETGAGGSTAVDAELQKLVDQTVEGAVFRKDLPFPTRLDVKTTRREQMSGRFYQSSAIGNKSEIVKGTRIAITHLEHAAGQVRYTLEQSSFSIPTPENPEGATKAAGDTLGQVASPAKPVTYRKSGKTWRSEDRDGFRAAVLSKQLTPVFDLLLIENALAPRTLWFAKRRLKIGDQVIVSGDSLPMLLAGDAKGSITAKLESFEPVEGHPCGVFSVTGDFSRKNFPDFEGNVTDEDITIQSGKIWLSLVYPVILKEELDTIQTFKSGGQGGLVARGQGTVKVSVTRAWKRIGS